MSQSQPTEYEYRLLTQVADLSWETSQFREMIASLQATVGEQAERLAKFEPVDEAEPAEAGENL